MLRAPDPISTEVTSGKVKSREISKIRYQRGEQISERMWNLVERCWDRNPRHQPSCEDICSFIKDLGIRDPRPPIPSNRTKNLAVWEEMRASWDSEIDYQRVYNVLFRASCVFPWILRLQLLVTFMFVKINAVVAVWLRSGLCLHLEQSLSATALQQVFVSVWPSPWWGWLTGLFIVNTLLVRFYGLN